MSIWKRIKPDFWDHLESSRATGKVIFNFRRIWRIVATLTVLVALIPLAILAAIDYKVSREAVESETVMSLSRLVSNTRQSVAYFFDERLAALKYLNLSKSYISLRDQAELQGILENMQDSFGGVVDLGVIDDQGIQVAYAGPFSLKGRNYAQSEWFKSVRRLGIHVSEVFEGYRNVPHLVVAIKHDTPDSGYYLLRVTLDLSSLGRMLTTLEIEEGVDVFLINRQGILQTPSRYYGSVLDKISLTLPDFSFSTEFEGFHQAENDSVLIGYTYINPANPLVLMSIKPKDQMMESWNKSKIRIISILAVSVVIVVIVILSGTTYLVNQIYHADQRRMAALHEVEYNHKMASLGRLSAGIAHEINNPLAIIGQKAGLAGDLMRIKGDYERDPKMVEIIDSIVSSVDRCANITHQLLNFARHTSVKQDKLIIKEVVEEVLSFMGKEASYKGIEINVICDENVFPVESDRGRLQEIMLNLFTNAFAAMEDGGTLNISIKNGPPYMVSFKCEDTGHGIPENDLERIFEPFFSTKTGRGGTGLGLSITYRLVDEIGGKISVQSKVGQGTTFWVSIPIKRHPENHAPRSAPGI